MVVNPLLSWGLLGLVVISIAFVEGVEVGIATILLILSFLLARWPSTHADAATPWVLLLCVLAIFGLFGLAHRPWTGAASGILWFMLSMLIYNYRTHWLELKSGLPRLLVSLAAWPATALLLARKQAPAPIIVACLLSIALTPSNRLYLLLPVWMVCTLAVLGLERIFAISGREPRAAR